MKNCPGLNHLLTCHDFIKADFIKGDNCLLIDQQGAEYLDFEAGTWCTVLGHNHPKILKTINDQATRLIHLNHRHTQDQADMTAKKLLNCLKMNSGKCIFLSSGSEAVITGLEMAELITGKNRFVTLKQIYLSAYGESRKRNDNRWTAFDWSVCEDCRESGMDCNNCRHFQKIDFSSLAAFVFDSGNSSGLAKFPPKKLIRNLVSQIRLNGGLVVIDEVTTGFGKTGKWFGFQHYDIQPDIVATGKGLGNGYPVSCVSVTKKAAQRLESENFAFAQSHINDPLGCAVASTVLDVIVESDLINRCIKMSGYFFNRLNTLQEHYQEICDIRGRGLMIAVEFFSGKPGVDAKELAEFLYNQRILVGTHPGANILRFYPPLTVSTEEIDRLILEISNALNECTL